MNVWVPPADRVMGSEMYRFAEAVGMADPTEYAALHRWSVADRPAFWSALWDFAALPARPAGPAVADDRMPGARWFPGAELSYASVALAHDDGALALLCCDETGTTGSTTFGELRAEVARVAGGLAALGVGRGDRVAAVLPTRREAVVAFLATVSLGAVWVLCSPEFGAASIVSRLAQTEPTVLLTTDAYRYNGRVHDVREKLVEAAAQLPTLAAVVEVSSGLVEPRGGQRPWAELLDGSPVDPVDVPFDHPLWILFSSGTTGIPKAMVQGHGGIVLEHLKSLVLHNDLRAGQRLFWYTSTAWMMWNYQVGALLAGATAVLYDGVADPARLWSLVDDHGVHVFGASPGFYQNALDGGHVRAGRNLHTVGSTGSPLLEPTQRDLGDALGHAVKIASVSGGTDVCSAFVGPNPLQPVRIGEMQGRMLGVAAEAFDAAGRPLVDEIGELVVTAAMPSMPLGFWGDDNGSRMHETYFATYPGVWRHGDWVRFTAEGGAVITGRSDATLNRGGVRMGTSEFYRVLADVPEIEDALVVDTDELTLFVVLADGSELDDDLRTRIRTLVRSDISPRHVPDTVVAVPAIPYTLTGKKCEIPVKRLLLGATAAEVADPQSLRNPEALFAVVEAAAAAVERSAP
ncbi:acetoacetate--CoA ligase [Pseudonocardia halophobica]|uniref:Acetoacetate-CoA ligase n=1 Tax=Pseudonocardia halophobica TaxID=29401 RepID=A0A9W6L0B1_9PSEU|nr:acetoacetate--CoA ligase [Pseudonocardia halophobica]GLL09785.1 acetoacetate-CoA ligase [Pseudonocardia halophobica]